MHIRHFKTFTLCPETFTCYTNLALTENVKEGLNIVL